MGPGTVQSGIPVLGEISRGAHFCQFYERPGDLLETVVPYFKAGLEQNEACVWVTDSDVTVADATAALRSAVPDFEISVKSGQIQIVDSYDWYTGGSGFDADAVLAKWLAKEESAISCGFEGARVSGSAFWLYQTHDSKTFADYEEHLNQAIKDRRIICLCSYALHRAHAMEVLGVVASHEFALARRSGQWEIVEAAALKAAKEELRRANETLELKVLQRTAEVERLLISEKVARGVAEREAARSALLFSQAQEAVRLRDEFLSLASHELYTPLHSLQLVVQGANRDPGALSPDAVARIFKLAARQCKRLVGLVGSLLDASRVAAGSVSLRLENVDLVGVVKDMLEELNEELARAGCALTISVPDGAVLGKWNRPRLEQLVANLLSNAAKFGAGKPIQVTVEKLDGMARLRVEDHGIGIAPERLPKIFERFERAVPSRQYGGLGLGLYIVKAIVEAMGGTARAESTIGAGATFLVDLPCGEPQQT